MLYFREGVRGNGADGLGMSTGPSGSGFLPIPADVPQDKRGSPRDQSSSNPDGVNPQTEVAGEGTQTAQIFYRTCCLGCGRSLETDLLWCHHGHGSVSWAGLVLKLANRRTQVL